MDSKLFGHVPRSGMSQRHPKGKNAPTAVRLRAVMFLLKDPNQAKFAKRLGVEMKRINNAMGGYPISIEVAQRVRLAVPGITRDWLYDGDESGLTVSLRDALRAAVEAVEMRLRTGAEA